MVCLVSVKICQPVEIMRYHLDVASSTAATLTNIDRLFHISHFLGIRTEALRTVFIEFTYEQVPAGEAFHLFLVTSGDLILDIVAQ